MDGDIVQTVQSCHICQQYRPAPPPTPLQPWKWPSHPWSRLHLDYAGPFLGHTFLIVVDAHSKWLEVFQMPASTSRATIQQLRALFAQFGLPQTIVTDNGPCFSSEEFTFFLKNNGILHLKSAPYHPSSNGLAERAVQTFKQGMKKFTDGDLRDRLSRFLAHYRTTPHTTTGVCPAELLLGRRPRTRLDLLRPSVSTRVDHKQLQQKQVHDDKARVQNFSVGERIYTWQYGRGAKNWVPGQIIEQMGSVSFRVELSNGTVCQRHQDQIRKRHDPVDTAPMPTMVEPPDQDTSVPSSATVTLPEQPRSDELPSLSPQRPDSTEHSHPQATVVEEALTTRRYPARDRWPPDRLTYDS